MSSLKARFKHAESDYLRACLPVIAALRNGAPVEPGIMLAAVKDVLRRSIAWRKEFEKLCGKAAVDAVIAANPPKQRYELVLTRRRKAQSKASRAQAA